MVSSDEQSHDGQTDEHVEGPNIGAAEARQKGPWAATAAEGIVPTSSEDPRRRTRRAARISNSAAPSSAPPRGPDQTEAAEPDLRDAVAGPRQSDVTSAG